MGERVSKTWSLPRLTSDIGRSLLVVLAVLLTPSLSYANQGFNGMCSDGGIFIQVLGISATNPAQGSFPGCTVTVNIHGGGLATIFKDNIGSGTPLANPFTASLVDGSFLFYANNGRYDITVTATGLNYTYTDVIINDTLGGTSTAAAFVASTFADRKIVAQNPAFEGSTNLPPPAWVASGTPTLSYETTSPAPSKNQSLKISTTVQGHGVVSATSYSVVSGDTYSITAQAKSDGTGIPQLDLSFRDKNSVDVGDAFINGTTSTSWNTLTASGTVPATAIRAIIFLENNAVTQPSSVWFDDVEPRQTNFVSPVSAPGFQVNFVAAINTFLKGNGTSYVSGSPILASADFANQGTSLTVLHGNAAGNPSFGAVNLTTDVTGILPAANGGTGISSAGTTTTVLHGGGAGYLGVSLTADTLANQGSTTTLLHGNAAGQPSFTAVVDADLANAYSGVGTCTNQAVTVLTRNAAPTCSTITSSFTSGTFPATAHNLLSATHGDTTAASAVRGDGIFAIGATPTWQRLGHSSATGGYFKWNGTDIVASTGAAAGTGSCTNQFVTAENADGAPTCTTATLASAQFANQGTTTTVLHGNAAGNPSFAAVTLTTDVTGTLPVANGGTGVTTSTGTGSVVLNTSPSLSSPSTTGTDSGTETLQNKWVQPRIVALADAASITPTAGTADENTFSSSQVAGTLTVNAPSGSPVDGQKLVLRLKAANAQTYSFNATYHFSTTTAAPVTLAAGKTDYIGIIFNAAASIWDVVAVDQGHTD